LHNLNFKKSEKKFIIEKLPSYYIEKLIKKIIWLEKQKQSNKIMFRTQYYELRANYLQKNKNLSFMYFTDDLIEYDYKIFQNRVILEKE
jgi:hypothetical protein